MSFNGNFESNRKKNNGIEFEIAENLDKIEIKIYLKFRVLNIIKFYQ